MWFKPNKLHFLLITLSGVIVSFFGCAREQPHNVDVPVVVENSDMTANKPEDIKVNILLKTEGREPHQLANDLPSTGQTNYDASATMAQITNDNNKNYGYTEPSAYGNLYSPFNESYGPGIFGAPFFVPGYSFAVSDFVDEDSNDDDRANDDDVDNRSDDDDNNKPTRNCGRCGENFADP